MTGYIWICDIIISDTLLQVPRDSRWMIEGVALMNKTENYRGLSYDEKINVVADTLNQCKMLYFLNICKRDRHIVLEIQTEKVQLEYIEKSKMAMRKVLIRLKEKVKHPEDIDELLFELDNLVRVPMKSTLAKKNRVLNMYHHEKKPISQIARDLKMDFQTVKSILIEHSSIQPLRTLSETQRLKFEKLAKSGLLDKLKQGRLKKLKDPTYIEKLSKTKEGSLNPLSKLTEEDVKQIRQSYIDLQQQGLMKTESQKILARKYGVKRATISDIVLKRTWKHI